MNSSMNSLGMYFREVSRIDSLNDKEKIDLEEKMQKGNRQVRNKLVEINLKMVIIIAKEYKGKGVPFLDLIQEGNLGLIKAVEKCDYKNLKYTFRAYADWYIRGSIIRAIITQARPICFTIHIAMTINKFLRICRDLSQKLKREPNLNEIANRMEISENRVKKILEIDQELVSLENPVGEEKDSCLGDFIEDKSLTPFEMADRVLLKERLSDVLDTLDRQEERLLELKYGLSGCQTHNLEEIAEKLGKTQEEIQEIETSALRKLKHPSRSKKLEEYLD